MKKLFAIILFAIVGFLFIGTTFSAQPDDRLKKTFKESHQPSGWSWDPFSSDIEADDMFNTNAAVSVWGWWVSLWTSDSVFVRFGRWLMRIWVMLSIPILLFWAIRVMLAMWDSWKLKEALKQVWMLVLWLLLLLWSVMIIFLITSLTRSALPDFAID